MQGGFITACGRKICCGSTVKCCKKRATAADTGLPHELLLLDLYCALEPLDAITGATTADDILNRIFLHFASVNRVKIDTPAFRFAAISGYKCLIEGPIFC